MKYHVVIASFVIFLFFGINSVLAENPTQEIPLSEQNQVLDERIKILEEKISYLENYLESIGRFTIPKEVEFCGQKIPVDKWYVREELEKQMLALSYNRRQVVTWMKRSPKFLPYVEDELKKAGMPDCIKYLMVVESSLLEDAYSRAGASGIWQFMQSTGRVFDLSYSKFIDERRNFEKATMAAFSYLKNLHNEFRDWPLAFAGYNAGENKVRLIKKDQGVNDYWRMLFLNKNGFPTETNAYVYKIIAVKLIFENPKEFGFILREEDKFLIQETKEVVISLATVTPLSEIGMRYGTSLLEIKKLNPWIRGDKLGKGVWKIKVSR